MNPNAAFKCCLALSLLCCLAPAASAESSTTNTALTLSLPGLTWALEIEAPAFTDAEKELVPQGDAARFFAKNEESGVILSAFLEKAPGKGGVKECRDFYWARAKDSPLKKDDIKLSETGELALVEYMIKEHAGMKAEQKNINAYLAKDGYWMDVHLSKADFKPGDDARLRTLLKGIRINERFVPSASDDFTFGRFFYLRKQFDRAIPCFERLLEAEKIKPTLPREGWLLAMDDLVIAHGMSGNLTKARELCEYGLTQAPEHPYFYYNLACAYAEMGNKGPAMENLRKAYRYKANLPKGGKLPDARTDSSFAKYRSDPDFARVLAENSK